MSRIAAFPEHAVWCDVPVQELPREALMAAFAYKVLELAECYKIMTPEQAREIKAVMSDVLVPMLYDTEGQALN